MNCKDKGWKEGQIFEVINYGSYGEDNCYFKIGSIIILVDDDGSDTPYFDLIKGPDIGRKTHVNTLLKRLERIYPREDKVTIVCEGKTVEISRESAKALNLI